MKTFCTICACFMLAWLASVGATDELPPGFERAPSQISEPGLTFGPCRELAMPKNILYSANPDQIIADGEAWQARGMDGFFMGGVVSGWEGNVWATDGKPWTIGEADATLQRARRANAFCAERGMETFALMHFSKHFDWFDDTAWNQIDNNFRQFAIFAREAGCKGIVIDVEYVMPQYYFEWEGYDYDGYTRENLVQAMRTRMTGVAAAMYDEFPDMVLIVMPELDLRLGTHIQTAWIEEAARRDAPGGVHYCMGYVYRNHNLRYILGRGWLDNMLIQRLLSRRGRRYWERQCGLSPAMWPFGIPEYLGHGPELTPEELRHGLAGSLMIGRQYTWIYTGACYEQLLGRNMDAYRRDESIKDYIRVLGARDMVTTPKYVALAKEVRSLKLRDYSTDLGLGVEVAILGPNDYGMIDLVTTPSFSQYQQEEFWELAIKRFNGRSQKGLKERFGTQTDWMLIGPFPNEGVELRGHHTAYPPEESINLNGTYDGVDGTVRWIEHRQQGGLTSVDLTSVFTPTEHVCAYALCYVTVPEETRAVVRLGTNDSGKLWLGDKLVFDYPREGGAILDRNAIPVTLPSGTTPLLLKVCNGEGQWGFVFRITDDDGRPIPTLRYSLNPAAR